MHILSFESIFRLLAVLKCPSNVSRYSSFIIHCAGYQVHLLRHLESHDLEERAFFCSLTISSKPVSPFHFLELLLHSYFITLFILQCVCLKLLSGNDSCHLCLYVIDQTRDLAMPEFARVK